MPAFPSQLNGRRPLGERKLKSEGERKKKKEKIKKTPSVTTFVSLFLFPSDRLSLPAFLPPYFQNNVLHPHGRALRRPLALRRRLPQSETMRERDREEREREVEISSPTTKKRERRRRHVQLFSLLSFTSRLVAFLAGFWPPTPRNCEISIL